MGLEERKMQVEQAEASCITSDFQQEVLFSHERVRGYEHDTIKMYNHFMDHMLPYIIQEHSHLEIIHENDGHKIQFKNICIHRPTAHDSDLSIQTMKAQNTEPLKPMEARNRNLTYSCTILIDVEHTVSDSKGESVQTCYRSVPLCAMPVMIGSKYCWTVGEDRKQECLMDKGGYFIIRGITKVLQPQKKPRINTPVIKFSNDGYISCEIRSLRADEKYRSSSTLYIHVGGVANYITVDIPFLKGNQNILVAFRLLGCHTRDSIETYLGLDEAQLNVFGINYSSGILELPMPDIFKLLSDKQSVNEKDIKTMSLQISSELLPHVGFDDGEETREKKRIYLGFLLRRILDIHLKRALPDDRDFEGFKSVEMSAAILAVLFRQLFNNYIRKTLRNKIFDRLKKSKHIDIASSIIHSESLTKDLHKAFTDGEVTVQKDSSNAGMGVIQMTNQTNCLGVSTHLTRVSTPLPRDNKYTIARQVDTTHIGAYCPAETPEGEGAGLLQNLATFANVRIGIESNHLIPSILPLLDPLDRSDNTIVYVNSEPIGRTMDKVSLVNTLRQMKQRHALPYDCSVIYSHYGVFVSSDMGTVMIPILDLSKLQTFTRTKGELWKDLVDQGIVLYVDPWELLDFRVAFVPKEITLESQASSHPFTHIFPHPCAMFATCASTSPYLNHNQAPRIPYQAGMVKQAIGMSAFNQNLRFDLPSAYQLWYPQLPVCDTDISRAKQIHEYPLGQNLIIAIASHMGLTAEDSIVFNKATSDRGACRVYVSNVFKSSCKKGDCFENPMNNDEKPKCVMLRGNVNYDTVDLDGFPPIGIKLRNNDVIIGKTSIVDDVRRDKSVILSCLEEEEHIVTDVLITTSRDGVLLAKVKTRCLRILQEGDKLASRHGQKGTVGFLQSPENLPFVAGGPNAGMVPDVIINLHCMNGRMTIGKEIEILMSSLGIVHGEFQDATAFKDVNLQEAMDFLTDKGYCTEEPMINGMTGEPMNSFFIGSCFYQVLKHFVLDKITARQRGARAALTRQPVDGRANKGGQRFGEMEVQVLEAQGAAYCLDDRMRISADSYEMPVCKDCGHTVDLTSNTLRMMEECPDVQCRQCGSTKILLLPTTYSYGGLFLRELATLGIKVEHGFV